MRWLADGTIDHLGDLPDLPSPSDRYELREEIGRGGMGTVYRAFDRELQRDVAIKVLSGVSAGAAARLLSEARILGRLEHPGILPIHDVGTLPDGRLFYVMKLVRGERLDDHLAGAPSLADRLRIFDRLCDAVAFAHAQGVVHRDLKPANIMIGAFGEVLVLDWGIAKLNSQLPTPNSQEVRQARVGRWDLGVGISCEGTEHGTVLGTPGYMAPEQAAGDTAVDERADVYALGGILAMLVSARNETCPRPLAAIMTRARELEASNRYPSVSTLALDVKRFIAGQAVDAYRESLPERIGRLTRRHRVPIALVVAYLLMRIILLLASGA